MNDPTKVTPIPTGLMAKDIMANPAKASDTNPLPVETIEVTNIDQFVALTADWHQRKIARLTHMAAVPEGVEIEIGEGVEAKTLKLVGDVHQALVLGVKMAISEFKTLPFAYTEEEVPAANDDAAQPAPPADGG